MAAPRGQHHDAPPGPVLVLAFALILALALGFAYGEAAQGFFVCDDFSYLYHAATAENLWQRMGLEIGWMFLRPLTALSFSVDRALFGLEPLGYHLVNLGLHLGSSLLLAGAALRLGCTRLGAACCGAAFALSPMQVEAVSWVSGRGELVFGLGAALCLFGWTGLQRARSRGALGCCLGGLVLALAGKDSGMVLPPLLSLWWLFPGPRSRRCRLAELAMTWAVLCLYLPLRYLALGRISAGDLGASGMDLWLLPEALLELLAPGHGGSLPWLGLGLCAYALLRRPQLSSLALPAALFLACLCCSLLPAMSIGLRLDPEGEGNRVLYLPAMCFALLLGQLFSHGRAPGDSRGLSLVALALLLVYGLGTHAANRAWAQAGATTRSILDQLVQLRTGPEVKWLAVYNLPDRIRGAQVFRNGLPHALELFISPPLSVGEQGEGILRDRAQWDELAARRRLHPDARPDWLLVRWDPVEQRLVTP